MRCDNPQLTIRGLRKTNALAPNDRNNGTDPYRVIWTRAKENIPKESYLFTDEHRDKTIVLENCPLREGLQNLAARGISSVLVEGGGITLGKAFEENLVDEVRFYIAPIILGGTALALQNNGMIPAVNLKNLNVRQLQPDCLMTAVVAK